MSVRGEASQHLDAIVRETQRGHSHRTRVILSVDGEPSASGGTENVRRSGEPSDPNPGGPDLPNRQGVISEVRALNVEHAWHAPRRLLSSRHCRHFPHMCAASDAARISLFHRRGMHAPDLPGSSKQKKEKVYRTRSNTCHLIPVLVKIA
jgi:hypothetical protein